LFIFGQTTNGVKISSLIKDGVKSIFEAHMGGTLRKVDQECLEHIDCKSNISKKLNCMKLDFKNIKNWILKCTEAGDTVPY